MAITQTWIDAIMQSDIDCPDVVGRTELSDKLDAWALRYIATMIERGVPMSFALENYQAGEARLELDPEQAAIDEMSYWDDDGDG